MEMTHAAAPFGVLTTVADGRAAEELINNSTAGRMVEGGETNVENPDGIVDKMLDR
jgi:hypothetical protein